MDNSRIAAAVSILLLLTLLVVGTVGVVRMRPAATGLQIRPLDYAALPGWRAADDDQIGLALSSFQRSCEALLRRQPGDPVDAQIVEPGLRALYGQVADWIPVCAEIPASTQMARDFFETNFAPFFIYHADASRALFTGYFEPVLRGSRVRQGPYQYPLYARPEDLVSVELGQFRTELAGKRIAGRVESGWLVPFESRAEIEQDHPWRENLVLLWLDSQVDSFFLHIQGSGRVELPDGNTVRVNFDGQNGHPYTAIGRYLIERGEIPREKISLQSIKAWLEANIDAAAGVMNENASYIFFRELNVSDPELGPPGAQGVNLTPGASIAVDRLYYPMSAPVWLSIDMNPAVLAGDPAIEGDAEAFYRLTIAQDTGGAIKGAQRADYYWGSGETAGRSAGLMQERGDMYVLVPGKLARQAASAANK